MKLKPRPLVAVIEPGGAHPDKRLPVLVSVRPMHWWERLFYRRPADVHIPPHALAGMRTFNCAIEVMPSSMLRLLPDANLDMGDRIVRLVLTPQTACIEQAVHATSRGGDIPT